MDTYKTEMEDLLKYEKNKNQLYVELMELLQRKHFLFDIIPLESFAEEYIDSDNQEYSNENCHWWFNHVEAFQCIAMILYTFYFQDPKMFQLSISKANVKLKSSTSTLTLLPQYRFFETAEGVLNNLEVIFYRDGDVFFYGSTKESTANAFNVKSCTIFKNLKSSKTKAAAAEDNEDINPVVVSPSIEENTSPQPPKVTPTNTSSYSEVDSEWQSPTLPQARSSQRQKKPPMFLLNNKESLREKKKESKKVIKKPSKKTVVSDTTSFTTKSTPLTKPKGEKKSKTGLKNDYLEHHHYDDDNPYHATYYDDAENNNSQDIGFKRAPYLFTETGGDNPKHPTKRPKRSSDANKHMDGLEDEIRKSAEYESMILAAVQSSIVEAKKGDTSNVLSKTLELQKTVEELKAVAERLRAEAALAEKEKIEAEKRKIEAEQRAENLKLEAVRIMADAEKHKKIAEDQKAEAQLQQQLRYKAEQDAEVNAKLALKDKEFEVLQAKYEISKENQISKEDIRLAEMKGAEFFQKGLVFSSESLKESFSLVQSVLLHSSSSSSSSTNTYNPQHQSTLTVQQHDPAAEERKRKREWRREIESERLQKQIAKAEKEAAELAASVKQVAELKAAADRKVKVLITNKKIMESDSDDN